MKMKVTSEDDEEYYNNSSTTAYSSSGNTSCTGSGSTSGSYSKSEKDVSWTPSSSSSSSNARGSVNRRAAMGTGMRLEPAFHREGSIRFDNKRNSDTTSSGSSDALSRSMRSGGYGSGSGSGAGNSLRTQSEKYDPDKFAKLADANNRRNPTVIASNGTMYVACLDVLCGFVSFIPFIQSYPFHSLSLHSPTHPFH